MMAKNLPAFEATWKIAYRFILDAVSAVKSLFAGEGTYFIAVFNAHISFLGWLLSHKKQPAIASKKGVELKGYLKKSVVWSHFIQGKKKFEEIVKEKA